MVKSLTRTWHSTDKSHSCIYIVQTRLLKMGNMKLLYVVVLWCLLGGHVIDGFNILVFPVHLPSRENFYEFLQTHLNYADHNVSFLVYKSDTRGLKIRPPPQTVIVDDESSLRAVPPRSVLESWEQNALGLVGSWNEQKHSSLPDDFLTGLASRCQTALADQNLIDVLNQMELDLVLVDLFGNDLCGVALAKKLKVVVAGYLTGRLTEPFAYKLAAPFNPAYLSVTGGNFNLDNLFDRLSNAYRYVRMLSYWDEVYFDVAADAACADGKKCTDAANLYRHLSMVFINSDLALETSARPLSPNVVFLGGLHCQVSTLLPKEVDSVARSYRAGVIYVSLVTAMNGTDLPKQLVDVIVEGLGSLPYATFWKTNYSQSNLTSHPKNVFLDETYSTENVLGHGRTRLAITLCDTNSVISCVYHGVPVICIPLTEEQLHTARTVVVARAIGVAITLDKLTSATLAKAAQDIVANNSYRTNSRHAGELLRDKPETPSDRLVFWVEYTIRRRGLSVLWVPAVGMGLFRYLFLDALAMLVFSFFVAAFATFCVFKVSQYRRNVSKEKIAKSD